MSNRIENHFQKILNGDGREVLSDFSKKTVCIAHVNGKSETLLGKSAAHLLWNLEKVLFPNETSEVEVLLKRVAGDYGVLTLKSECFSDFISYSCIEKNGKIAYMTLYVHEPSCNILPKPCALLAEGKQAKKLFYRHVRAMFSVSADVIAKDYSENGIVMTNMAKDTCNGKAEIHAFCDELMKSSWKIIKKLRIHGFPSVKWKTKSAADGLMLFVCEVKAFGSFMTETYWVEDGKIQFESAVCGGEMPKLVQDVLK